MEKEQVIERVRTSQVVNLGWYILLILGFWLVIPIIVAVWKWLEVRSVEYTITNQRLLVRSGIFSKKTEEIELYRVKDTRLEEPFFLRLFNCGHIILITSDQTTPTLLMRAIPHAQEVREVLRRHIEARRDSKGVREIDME